MLRIDTSVSNSRNSRISEADTAIIEDYEMGNLVPGLKKKK